MPIPQSTWVHAEDFLPEAVGIDARDPRRLLYQAAGS